MGKRSASSRLRRNAALSLSISLLFVGILVFLLHLLPEKPAQPDFAPSSVVSDRAASTSLESAPSEPRQVENEGPDKGETGEKAEVVSLPEPGPPMLLGKVTGEGGGIERASIILFSTKRLEELIDKLQDLAPQGEMPDIPALISSVLSELEAFKRMGIAARTTPDGYYEFRGLEGGGYFVLAVADEWLFRYGDVVSLSPERTETLDLELTRGASISGRVVSASGAGIPRVRVLAELRPAGIGGLGIILRRFLRYLNGEFLRGPFEVGTSEDGSFNLSSLPPGLYDLRAVGPEGIEARLTGIETGNSEAVIYLGKGAVVKGYLTDGSDMALAGIVPCVERQDDLVQLPLPFASFNGAAVSLNRLITEGPRKATSGQKGEFEVGPLAPGKYKLSVEERGFLPFARTIEVDWGQNLNLGSLRIGRGEAITGIVRSAEGAPIERAKILATPMQVNMFNMGNVMSELFSGRVSATSDASGAFRLAGLTKGQYRVVATAQGFAAGAKKGVEAGGEPLALQLKPGVRVSGRVVEAGGKPIAAARVKAGEIQGKSGEDGRFALEGVAVNDPAVNPFEGMSPAGAKIEGAGSEATVDIHASAPGYLPGEGKVDLASGRTEVDIDLEKAPQITGTVFDPDGKPLPGSLVRLIPGEETPAPFDTLDPGWIFLGVSLSDLEGKFHFANFRSATKSDQYQVRADHPLYARGFSSKFKLRAVSEGNPGKTSASTAIEVHLARGCKVKGTITDGAQPIAGAVVRLSKKTKQDAQAQQMNMVFSMMGLPKGGETVYSSREGQFEYDRVQPGDYVVTAEALGFTDSSQLALTLEPGDEREASLVLNPGGEIAGVVVDPAGSPVEGARVRLLRTSQGDDKNEKMILETQKFFGGSYKSTRTKDDGAFRIQGLPAGTYTLSVERAGYSPQEVSHLSPGQAEQRIVLLLSAALRGLVVDAANRQPITHFQVRFKLLSPEEAPKAEPEDFDLAYLRNEREYHDLDGRFLRDDLDGGKYEVKVTSSGYSPTRLEVILTPGATLEEEFSLAQAGRIRGVILDVTTQRPIPGVKVGLTKKGPRLDKGTAADGEKGSRRKQKEERASRDEKEGGTAKDEDNRAMGEFFLDEWTSESALSGEDGGFLLEGVPQEPQRVVTSHASYITEWKDGVEVGPGQEAEITFLLRAGLTVSGKVSDAKGKALEGRLLFLRGASEANAQVRKSTVSGRGGEFQIGGLEKGSYRLVIPSSGNGTSEPQGRDLDLRESESGVDVRVEEN